MKRTKIAYKNPKERGTRRQVGRCGSPRPKKTQVFICFNFLLATGQDKTGYTTVVS